MTPEQTQRLLGLAAELYNCAASWDPAARLLGNVRAEEIMEVCEELKDRLDAREVGATFAGNDGGELGLLLDVDGHTGTLYFSQEMWEAFTALAPWSNDQEVDDG